MPIPQETRDAILTDITATGKTFGGAVSFIRPYLTGPTGRGHLGMDFTFSGAAAFAPQAVTTWGGVEHLSDGRSAKAGPALTFTPASSADAGTFLGFVIGDDSVTTNVREWVPFAAPMILPDQFAALVILPRVAMGENASFDASVVVGP